MPYIEESLEKFNSLPPEIILSVDNDKVASAMYELNEKYNINFGGLIIFVSTGDLSLNQVPSYLETEFGLDKITAKKAFDDVQRNVFIPLKKRLDFLNANHQKNIKINEERDIALDIFENNLKDELQNNQIIVEAINARIFYILSQDLNFKIKLEKAIYNNSELITHESFEMDGSPQTPTVGNWIQDFIIENGSEMFDNLSLSRYMTSSKNTRVLNFDDRKIVQKLLLLYRNIKFFPESMPTDNPDDWEIIPTDKGVDNLAKARFVSGPPKTEEEKEIDAIRSEEEKYAVGGLERLALDEEISRKKQLEDLKIIANKYRDGSLEKSAILEEIKKLDR